jgi:SAM-dependent methyltransferase
MDNFVQVPVSVSNIDRWIVRKSIFRFIESNYGSMHGDLLDVGCGKMPYKASILANTKITSYTGLDIDDAITYDSNVKPDVVWDGRTMPLNDGQYETVLATEVLEHVLEPQTFLREVHRVMKSDGKLFFTTPFVWPYHEAPHDRQRWTSFGLTYQLTQAGFTSIELKSVGNWHSTLAQMLGLWVARSKMNRVLRLSLKFPCLLSQLILMRFDAESMDVEASMPRMIAGSASKP